MDEKLNFGQITSLIVDSDPFSTSILSQILRGFGLTKHTIVDNGEDAKRRLANGRYELLICEAELPDMPVPDLVRWIRHQPVRTIKYMPIVVLTGYTQMSTVITARDAGANIVVRKPVAPNILLDHIAWAARSERLFIETDDYIGPCRRFKNQGPPGGVGRRATDLTSELGEAKEPNLSQEEIDSFIRPTKVVIE